MPFVPFENVLQVNVRYEMVGQDFENVYYFRNILAAWTVAEANVLLDELEVWADTYFAPCLATLANVHELYAVDLSSATSFYTSKAVVIPGTVAVDPLTTDDAAVITWMTSFRGRSFRGRSYWGGVPKSFLSNGLMTSAAATLYATAATQLLNVDGAIGAQMCVASRVAEGVERTEGVATPIVDYRVNATLGNQRRRRIGVGA